MSWHGELRLRYMRDPSPSSDASAAATRAHDAHHGPLRVLKALYPEGPAVCHHVMVHPPAGLVSGDRLDVDVHVGPGAHALITTPSATRWYRARNPAAALEDAAQSVCLQVDEGGRLEWMPLESLLYEGAQATNHLSAQLAPGASLMGWDMTAFGLPAADQPYTRGWLDQRLELRGLWLEAGRLRADDDLLMNSPLGLAGHRAMATAWLAWGHEPTAQEVEPALTAARQLIDTLPAELPAGVTRPHPQVMVLRALGARTEPVFKLLRQLRIEWRRTAWQLPPTEPRVWAL